MYGLVKCVLTVLAATAVSSYNMGEKDIIFHLYTRSNPQQSQALLPSVISIMKSTFSVSRRTIVTIHSNPEYGYENFNNVVIPAHLAAEDVNIIAVEWNPGSGVYIEGLANAPQCGKVIAKFMNILVRNFGYDPDMIRIVGIGLGGHIAGIAARRIDGGVPHIIALDPSLFGWTNHPEILRPDDAFVVEVLHTSAGSRGYDYPLGDIDFYPNGGSSQADCGNDANCSQIHAYLFYVESIIADTKGGKRFVGTACESYEQAKAMACTGDTDAVFGGLETKLVEAGIYIFSTNSISPFARG